MATNEPNTPSLIVPSIQPLAYAGPDQLTAQDVATMKIYRLKPEGYSVYRRQLVLLLSSLYAIIFVGSLVIIFTGIWSYDRKPSSPATSFIVLGFFILLFTASCWRALRKARHYWSSFELVLCDDLVIRRYWNTPTITIRREDVKSIVRDPSGAVFIKTSKRLYFTAFPKSIESYAEICQRLERWKPISAGRGRFKRYAISLTPITVVMGLYIALMITMRHPLPNLLIAAALMSLMVFGLISVQKNPNVDRKVKLFALWLMPLAIIGVSASIVFDLLVMLGYFTPR